MPRERKSEYVTDEIRQEIARLGLIVDEEMLERAGDLCQEEGLSQRQFDRIVFLHIKAVVRHYDRKLIPFKYRIMLALYWLGFGRSIV